MFIFTRAMFACAGSPVLNIITLPPHSSNSAVFTASALPPPIPPVPSLVEKEKKDDDMDS
jgi:hypothetical protein